MKTRKEYIEHLAQKIREWDERLDELKGRLDTAALDAREKLREEIGELRTVTEKAQRLLVEAHEAGAETWDKVRPEIDRLLARVKEMFGKAA